MIPQTLRALTAETSIKNIHGSSQQHVSLIVNAKNMKHKYHAHTFKCNKNNNNNCPGAPCTYPGRSYLESLHRDAHCVPNFGTSWGHEEFRTLWSSWKGLGGKKKKERGKQRRRGQKVIVVSVKSKSCRIPVLSQGERDKYNFLSIKVMGREAGDLRVLSSHGLRRIYSPLERKGTKLGRYSLREENWSAPGGV